MHAQLAMNFGMEFHCPAELESRFTIPGNLYSFLQAMDPILRAIIEHHPNRDPDSPSELLWRFQTSLLTVPEVKNRRQRWRSSTTSNTAHRPIPNVPYWQQYDPAEPGQVPYVTWFLRRFAAYITRIGLF